MVDLQENDRWTELGQSRAWNWQQGCMLQWLPGSQTEVIWNDREDGRFVSHVLDVRQPQEAHFASAGLCSEPGRPAGHRSRFPPSQ